MTKKIISITTKTGDTGMSGLANGQRLLKHEPVFMALGDFDELNSWLGLIIVKFQQMRQTNSGEVSRILKTQIRLLELSQAWIYEASAVLAQSPKFVLKTKPLVKLEHQTNLLQTKLGKNWHTRFLYPGGSEMAAWLDITRTVARRTERSLVFWLTQAKASEISATVTKTVLPTFNRLSDYLYILRCWVNDQAQIPEKQFGSAKNQAD